MALKPRASLATGMRSAAAEPWWCSLEFVSDHQQVAGEMIQAFAQARRLGSNYSAADLDGQLIPVLHFGHRPLRCPPFGILGVLNQRA